MSISNPFNRPSPFKPAAYNNSNRIEQSHVSAFTPQSYNYNKWQPKHSLGNDFSKTSYNNYLGSQYCYSDSYSYQNLNTGKQYLGTTIKTSPSQNYLNTSDNLAAYKKKEYTPYHQTSERDLTRRDMMNDKNPFNRSRLLSHSPTYLQPIQQKKSYEINNNKYENLRYQGNYTSDYNQDYSPNKTNYLRDFDNKSDTASVATYINKIMDIDDRKSDYNSGINSPRLVGNSYQNNYMKYDDRKSINGLNDKYEETRFRDYDHLKYKPSTKDDYQQAKKGVGLLGGDRFKIEAISQKQIGKYDTYLDDGTGKFGYAISNNEEQMENNYKYKKGSKQKSFNYHKNNNYLQDQFQYDKNKLQNSLRYKQSQQQYQRYDKYVEQNKNVYDNKNKYEYSNNDKYQYNKNKYGDSNNKYEYNNNDKYQYNKNNKYNKNQYGQINKNQYNNYFQKNQDKYLKEQFQQSDHEIQKKRQTLEFQDYNDEDEQQVPKFHNRNKQQQPQKKKYQFNKQEQSSDQDAYYDFDKDDSFEQNSLPHKKTKIWDRQPQNKVNTHRRQVNYVQPSFGKQNQKIDQYSSPEFYVPKTFSSKEEVVREPSLQGADYRDQIVKFDEVSQDSAVYDNHKNVPSMDIDNAQAYPKLLQVHGTLFHRIQLDRN